MNDELGPILHSYTQAMALADGYLIDVSQQARTYGFKIPVILTRSVWNGCVEWTQQDDERQGGAGQSRDGRLFDLLTMAQLSIHRQPDTDRIEFDMLRVERDGVSDTASTTHLIMTCGPSEDMSACITIMYTQDD